MMNFTLLSTKLFSSLGWRSGQKYGLFTLNFMANRRQIRKIYIASGFSPSNIVNNQISREIS